MEGEAIRIFFFLSAHNESKVLLNLLQYLFVHHRAVCRIMKMYVWNKEFWFVLIDLQMSFVLFCWAQSVTVTHDDEKTGKFVVGYNITWGHITYSCHYHGCSHFQPCILTRCAKFRQPQSMTSLLLTPCQPHAGAVLFPSPLGSDCYVFL